MSEAHIDLLEKLLARLDEYARTVTRQQIETDLDTWLKVSRAMELAAQCCIDLALKLVSQRGLGIAESYREAFTRLAQAHLITLEHAAALQGWAGMRNSDLQPLHDIARLAARELLRRPS